MLCNNTLVNTMNCRKRKWCILWLVFLAQNFEHHLRSKPKRIHEYFTRSNNHQIAQEYPSARRLPILIGFRDAEPYIPLALSVRECYYGFRFVGKSSHNASGKQNVSVCRVIISHKFSILKRLVRIYVSLFSKSKR